MNLDEKTLCGVPCGPERRHQVARTTRAGDRQETRRRGPARQARVDRHQEIGNAVVRNRIKRFLREWLRLHGWVPPGWDMVVVAKDGAARQLHPDDFASDLTRILRQLS